MSRQRPRTEVPERMRATPISVTSALRLGVGRERLRGTDLAAPFHGVRSPGVPSTTLDAAQAYATRMPRWAVFSGKTAAQLIGAPVPARMRDILPLEVTVPSDARAPRRQGITGRSAVLLGHPLLLHGLRVVCVEDLWREMGDRLSVRELVVLGDYLIRRSDPWTSTESLEVVAGRARRGAVNLRSAVPLLDDRSESPPESDVRAILTLAGIRGLVPNHEVHAAGRRYRIDLAIPQCRVAIEYQGDYHRDRQQWRRDVSRRADLESAGWTVIELAADDLRDPARLVALVERAIARAAAG